MRVLAMLDGSLVDPETPLIRVDDLGLTRGDGVFETVLVVDGQPRELGPHLARLARSAAMLQLPAPDLAAWERLVETVVGAWTEPGEMAVKLVYTRGPEYGDGGPTGYAIGLPIGGRAVRNRTSGVTAITLARGYDPAVVERAPWLLLGAKTLSYAINMAAMRHAEQLGVDEVIFVGDDGTVLEGPTSTIVVASGGTLRTPPPSSGVLPGTTQGALFRAAERAGWSTKVEPVRADELAGADALFVVSSVRKVTRVHTLDGLPLPDSTELGAELSTLYEAEY
ncbi:aminodeoxychorismate lyase [Actinokineospora globicatena]|uniref:aminodeoxychorismate lyase n=1 Tax=Actinokineospora globicatena TaxID=103729 RepID=UPI0020A3E42F|nr:aminodeoxychorismate lyase [Actinokineospora globicatena]MCP2301513.1 4-amino-4-deoxychorismate lyase [Actinokineospora globicatena]GLW76840.1 4-amino-4-deoxychorismate lyase [Actinokineospora globicatena]GLW83673.1 4-amino-4-deoxychorismate lyase [Actinokineospora globicatena]